MKTNKTETINEIVMSSVVKIMEKSTSREWMGTMTQLSKSISKLLTKQQIKMLPRSPSALRSVLNRIVNRIRNRRIGVKFARSTDHMRTRYVKFVK